MSNESPIPEANNPECYFMTWNDANGQMLAMSKAAEGFSAIYKRTSGNFYRNFDHIDTNVSARTPFTREHYEHFRPNEAIPRTKKDVMRACMLAYKKVGLVRNVIDMMGDFACQGVKLVHPNPRIQKFYQAWWEKVKGKDRSERFLNTLYRCGQTIVRRRMARMPIAEERKMRRGKAKLESDTDFPKAPKPPSRTIPVRYIILNPVTVEVVGDELSTFVGKKVFGLKLPESLKRKIRSPKNNIEKKLVQALPQEVKDAAKEGPNGLVPLDPDKICDYYYKKDDWEVWADPMVAPLLDDLVMLEKMKMADLAALDGVISHVRLWKIGSLDHKIMPNDAMIAKLHDMLLNNLGGGAADLIWGPELTLEETKTDAHHFLGNEKYGPVLGHIYEGLGVPQSLTGGQQRQGFTNNFISMKTMIDRLNYGRDILRDFWNKEIQMVQEAMGFRFPARVVFDKMVLSDEAAQQQLILNMVDRNLISIETAQERLGEIPEIEEFRMRKEERDIKSGRKVAKAGPWFNPEKEFDLTKIFAQSGNITPSEAGLELNEKKDSEMSKNELALEMNKRRMELQSRNPGQPGEGRPKNSRDSGPRDQRNPKPRTSASTSAELYNLSSYAISAQVAISEAITPLVLKHYNKNSLRSLTAEQTESFEKMKFGVLCKMKAFENIEPKRIAEIIVNEKPKVDKATQTFYDGMRNRYIERFGSEPSLAERRKIQAMSYASIRI